MLSAHSTCICIKTIQKRLRAHVSTLAGANWRVFHPRSILHVKFIMECSLEFHVSFEGSIKRLNLVIIIIIIIFIIIIFGNKPFNIECFKAKTRELSWIQ